MSDVQGFVNLVERNITKDTGTVISLPFRAVQQVCLKERLSPILHWNLLGRLPPRVCHGMADGEKHGLSGVQIFLRMI